MQPGADNFLNLHLITGWLPSRYGITPFYFSARDRTFFFATHTLTHLTYHDMIVMMGPCVAGWGDTFKCPPQPMFTVVDPY